ncbi:MAG: carboxylating nicotinate-nucleotide diphosphorylase [Pseudohongiellaceae bacterium]
MPELPPIDDIERQVSTALVEDIGDGDITAALIPEDKLVAARVEVREDAVLCGCSWVDEVFRQLDPAVVLTWRAKDGARLTAGAELLTLQGPARSLLTGERSALNFLQTLSGTATTTAALVALVAHTEVRLLDTRKTIPGLRSAQKYAVRVGGGQNHRMGLFDAFLIKENHIAACGSIAAAVTEARGREPGKPVEVEVESLAQLEQAIAAAADIVMLDNFSPDQLRQAVTLNAGRCKLEASGNIDGESLVTTAETGVDYISIGALTKHCRAIDL